MHVKSDMNMSRTLAALPYGPDAWLLRFAETPGEAAFNRARWLLQQLETDPPDGLLEYVPGYTTLLLEFTSPESAMSARTGWIKDLLKRSKQAPNSSFVLDPVLHEIPVHYDGPDLQRIADHAGIGIDEVIHRHTTPTYRVALIGFAPGFPYLDGLDPTLVTPRLETPRPRIRAGSVAIGGEHAGIYPTAGPGGWNIVGHTDVALFDLQRGKTAAAMCFLHPGDQLRFVPC